MKSLVAIAVFTLIAVAEPSVICPDHKSQCPNGATCCLLDNNRYGCCPLPKAVCCSDHMHCCPQGTTCNLEEGKCQMADGSFVRMHRKHNAELRVGGNDIICGDHQATCPTGTTCCQMDDGQWGCCPLPQAVCCDDHRHCCPHGTTCDTAMGRCNKRGSTITVPWSTKIEAKLIRPAHPMPAVTCADKRTKCMGQGVCCSKANGHPGCCPFIDGVCCANGRTCCPFGFTCDVFRSVCTKSVGDEVLTMPTQRLEAGVHRKSPIVRCPNDSECPAKTTCCPTADGSAYSCCPLHNAVCCENTCCAEGFRCAPQGKCEKLAAVDYLF